MAFSLNEIKNLFENVFEFQKFLSRDENSKSVLENMLKKIREYIDYDIISLFMFEEKSQKLKLVVNLGEPQSLVDAVNFTLGKGGTIHSARKKVPILMRNKYQGNQFNVNSFLAYPIIHKGTTLGIVSMGYYGNKQFTKKHVLYFKIFSIYLQNELIFLKYGADNKQGT
ncbi:MAG: hypothetical protein Kow00108_11180 [Calditrichia bacterium]